MGRRNWGMCVCAGAGDKERAERPPCPSPIVRPLSVSAGRWCSRQGGGEDSQGRGGVGDVGGGGGWCRAPFHASPLRGARPYLFAPTRSPTCFLKAPRSPGIGPAASYGAQKPEPPGDGEGSGCREGRTVPSARGPPSGPASRTPPWNSTIAGAQGAERGHERAPDWLTGERAGARCRGAKGRRAGGRTLAPRARAEAGPRRVRSRPAVGGPGLEGLGELGPGRASPPAAPEPRERRARQARTLQQLPQQRCVPRSAPGRRGRRRCV